MPIATSTSDVSTTLENLSFAWAVDNLIIVSSVLTVIG
jgi:hypothetical protein